MFYYLLILTPGNSFKLLNGCFKDFINELRSHSIGLFEQVGFCLFRVWNDWERVKGDSGRFALEVKRSFHFPIEVPFVMIFQRHVVISHQNANVFKLLWFTATCRRVNNCTSPEHGSCKTTDVCQCNPGYIGELHKSFYGCCCCCCWLKNKRSVITSALVTSWSAKMNEREGEKNWWGLGKSVSF